MLRRSTVPLLALLVLPGSVAAQIPMGGEFRVNTYTTGSQYNSAVAGDEDGNFVVVWPAAGQGDNVGIFGRQFGPRGNPLGAEFRVNTYTTSYQVGPAVSMHASGNFVVVWYSGGQDGSSAGVFGQRYSPSGAPDRGEFQVNLSTFGAQYAPDVAHFSSGQFVIVWQGYGDPSDEDSGIFALIDSVGIPSELHVNTFTTSLQVRPAVAASAAGFVVVWASRQDGFGYGIFGQRFDALGNPLGPEFAINTYTPGDQWDPDVAADAEGNFVVVWQGDGQDGDDQGIFGQRFNSAGTAQAIEFQINTYTTGRQSRPAVARAAEGGFVVTWNAYEYDVGDEIVGQRFASNGVPMGSEFFVNSYTTGGQRVPAVAWRGGEKFVVTWSSSLQDGSDEGVFGQIYGDLIFADGFDGGS
jgi:hypothetical protein